MLFGSRLRKLASLRGKLKQWLLALLTDKSLDRLFTIYRHPKPSSTTIIIIQNHHGPPSSSSSPSSSWTTIIIISQVLQPTCFWFSPPSLFSNTLKWQNTNMWIFDSERVEISNHSTFNSENLIITSTHHHIITSSHHHIIIVSIIVIIVIITSSHHHHENHHHNGCF